MTQDQELAAFVRKHHEFLVKHQQSLGELLSVSETDAAIKLELDDDIHAAFNAAAGNMPTQAMLMSMQTNRTLSKILAELRIQNAPEEIEE